MRCKVWLGMLGILTPFNFQHEKLEPGGEGWGQEETPLEWIE